jgi:hypothetical protein
MNNAYLSLLVAAQTTIDPYQLLQPSDYTYFGLV